MPPTTRSIHAVYADGMEAREADQPATACPYPADSDEHAHWVDGWHEPDALDEDETADDPVPGVEGI